MLKTFSPFMRLSHRNVAFFMSIRRRVYVFGI